MARTDPSQVMHRPAAARPAAAGVARLAEAVAARSGEASERWLEALDRYLSVPRRQLSPDVTRLDDAPAVVAWITEPERGRVPDEVMAVLQAMVELREGQGGVMGDLYREFHLLSRILHKVLEEEAEAAGDAVTPADVAVEAGRLSRALLKAVGVATDIFDQRQRAERNQALDSFASVVRHELRNPLGAAQAAAQLLREDGGQLDAVRFERVLVSLERSVRHAVDVLGSVTSLSHDRPSDEVERWEALDEVLGRVVHMVRERAGDDVEVELAANLPALLVDADRFEILTHNLVENAVKYRDPRRECWVRIDVERDEPHRRWWLRVRDNGVGIAPDEQERIFHRFYRGGVQDVEGTGLGLSIAREAARQMGGVVEVESSPGEGSVFSACIPDERTRSPG